jgi:metal-sulfur cluster biosynthetic enzyme
VTLHAGPVDDSGVPAQADACPFPFAGDPALCAPFVAALRNVVDPEIALSIVDLGLVYGVSIADGLVRVRLTMTSAGCPLSDLIIDDIHSELAPLIPAGHEIEIELCWEPAWTPERLSARARQVLGW